MSNEWRTVKIGDFGKKRSTKTATNDIETIIYMAPEVLDNSRRYTKKCDMYSFAITLYEMFTRKKPYYDHVDKLTKQRLIYEISKSEYSLRPSLSDEVPSFIAALIRRLVLLNKILSVKKLYYTYR